jgi:1,4-dihydroxy-2-naphthoyl-CoA hydrolase
MSGDILGLIPFAKSVGLSVISDGPDEVHVRLNRSLDLCTSNGVLHGGVIMAMADTAGGIRAYRNIPPGASVTITIESKTNFLDAVTRCHICAIAKPIHLGTTLVVVDIDMRDDRREVGCSGESDATRPEPGWWVTGLGAWHLWGASPFHKRKGRSPTG